MLVLFASCAQAILSCGDTITDNTTLADNLLDCPGTGLIIGADNITLDCAGHSITGQTSDTGIYADGYSGLTIKNCIITNFTIGIYIANNAGCNITNNTADYHSAGIWVSASSGNNITYNNASYETSDGIRIEDSSGNNITNNTVNSSNGCGINVLGDSDNNVLSNNTAELDYTGICFQADAGNNITDNTACWSQDVYDIMVYSADNTGDNTCDGIDPDGSTVNCTEACPPHPAEWNCTDGIDNNNDGLTDCDDPTCSEDIHCQAEVCDNGVDDNANYFIDCMDFECYNSPACTSWWHVGPGVAPKSATNLPATVLVAPYLPFDGPAGVNDSRYSITNTGSSTETLRVFYVTNTSETDFTVTLPPHRTVRALAGRGKSGNGTMIPPLPQGFRGMMLAFPVDGDGNAVGHNVLIGSVAFKTSAGPYGGYNMVGFRSLNGEAGEPGVLHFNGVDLELWPSSTLLMHGHFFTDTDTAQSDRLVLVTPPNLITGAYYGTTMQFLVYNEFEQRFSTSRLLPSCYFESEITNIDTPQNARSIFARGVSGTVFGQTRIRPVSSKFPPAALGVYIHYDPNERTLAGSYSGVEVLASTGVAPSAAVNIPYPSW